MGTVKPSDCKVEVEGDCAGVNRITAHEVHCSSGKLCHFAFKTHMKEVLNPLQINKMFEQDFIDTRPENIPLSFEDRKFMKKTTDGVHQREDSHYELPLPFKQDSVKLPNNKEVALSRLSKLKGRLKHDSCYQKDYLAFMAEIIDCGFAERVPAEDIPLNNS